MRGTVMGGLVLVVRAGNNPVRNLSQPITLIFNHNKQVNSQVGKEKNWMFMSLQAGTYIIAPVHVLIQEAETENAKVIFA